MIKVWKKSNGRTALQIDGGMGSPSWNHWAILLYKNDGRTLRVELTNSDSTISRCGDWKLQSTFKELQGKTK